MYKNTDKVSGMHVKMLIDNIGVGFKIQSNFTIP
jgi:hypothetical protein